MKRLLLLLAFVPLLAHAQLTDLKPGMKITSSLKIRKAMFAFPATADMQKPVIEISGNDIVIDFNDAMLVGGGGKMPDEFLGIGILVKGGKNITIRNLQARGFKVAIRAENVEGLTIDHCNFSYNYRQRLNSTQEKEDICDWMSYHQNENNEWLRYGAGMYLRNCNKAIIQNNIVTGGQCALMLTLCNDGKISGNNFSFNSGIGIGMYRSSGNIVIDNKLDWNVRGHSEGIYNRGQDSAAILVFEQCNNNIFAYNSATHSGDGFFLWAGQSTMDSGEGGCNDNLIVMNDFSFAPTNGIEVTFSRNTIAQNRIEGCDHGIWGGYSFNTDIIQNQILYNRVGVAIEHGQENAINGNTFAFNRESLRLWSRKEQPKDWGYAQKRDTRSRNYRVVGNFFDRDSLIYNISYTSGIKLLGNRKQKNKLVYKLDSFTRSTIDSSEENARIGAVTWQAPAGFPRRYYNVSAPAPQPLGRKEIRITEWGPYDFRSPIVWRSNPLDSSGLLKFELLGPKGSWKVVNSRGVQGISKQSGHFPDVLTARRLPNDKGDIFIELEYTGQEITTPFGWVKEAGESYRFAFHDARIGMQWRVKWFAFDSASNPVQDPDRINELQAGKPLMTQQANALDFAWWGGLDAGGKKITQFLTTAEADVDVPPGRYELAVTWDDAVRLLVDGKLVFTAWDPSVYKFDESPHTRVTLQLNGKHKFRAEHAELGGFATLHVVLKKL